MDRKEVCFMDNLMTLRLGYSALNDWEALMIKEEMITGYAKDFYERDMTYTSKHTRVNNKKFLLFALMFFDRIDASHLSMFDMEKLVELNVVDEHAHMIESKLINMDETALLFQRGYQSKYNDNASLLASKEAAEEIMIANKKKIVHALLKQDSIHEYCFMEERELLENYDEWIQDCELWANSTTFSIGKESMGIIKESIMYGIYDSMVSGSIYYDGSIGSSDSVLNEKDRINAKDISRIMNIDLSPELYHLPIPSTVSEAIVLRNRPEIVAFRKVFFEWCKAFKQGDIDMIVRIKNDVRKAQKGLDKYYKWEKSNVKLFSCILDVVIGLIPYLSTVVGIISPFQTRNVIRKKEENSWVLLLK